MLVRVGNEGGVGNVAEWVATLSNESVCEISYRLEGGTRGTGTKLVEISSTYFLLEGGMKFFFIKVWKFLTVSRVLKP